MLFCQLSALHEFELKKTLLEEGP